MEVVRREVRLTPASSASPLKLRVVHLDTSSSTLRGWSAAADALVRRALAP